MASLNRVMIIGRLGKDPEVRYTKDGTAVCNLRIATSDQWTDKAGEKQEKTEWHAVVLWGRQAEIAQQYLQKGRLVYVEGSLQTRKWQDQNGQDKYTTEIKGQIFQMLDRGRDGGGGGGRDGDGPRPERSERGGDRSERPERPSRDSGPPPEESGPPPDEDDIPF